MTERVLRLVTSRRDRTDDLHGGANHDAAAALSANAGWLELTRELDRSRRSGHSFALLRVPQVIADGNGGMNLARTLPRRLRSVDTVWIHRRELFVLLPEADRAATLALVTRLRRDIPELLAGDMRIASFPEDGLTRGALLELLDEAPAHEAPALEVALQHRLSV